MGLCSDAAYPLVLRGVGILPSHMGNALATVSLGSQANVVSLTAANSSACALLASGETKCWGQNQYGQLGQGDTVSRGLGNDMGDLLPSVSFGNGLSVVSIHSGNFHNCARFSNQQVKCWGNNRFGGLGYGDGNHRGDEPSEMGSFLSVVSY